MIREMQNKTTGSYPLTSNGMATVKEKQALARCGEIGILADCRWDCKTMKLLWKTVQWLPPKLKVELPCGPEILLLSIYPSELKVGFWKDSYAPMCTATSFTTAKTWEATQFPSIAEWINKMLYTHTTKYYFKEILTQATSVNLKGILWREIKQLLREPPCWDHCPSGRGRETWASSFVLSLSLRHVKPAGYKPGRGTSLGRESSSTLTRPPDMKNTGWLFKSAHFL